ncbi:galactose-binding lectin l-1-like [Conger conger]|uniref:galactose-binding lectin l-1-like n=1 Tax=Conger conger TaxID=82655 RepID=UPI002A59C1BD|nr:galactose-binding lectin l-1-like [Conger conger]
MNDAEVINIPLYSTMKLTIKGVPEDSFTINVGKSRDIIALQYNVHFSQGVDQSVINMRCIRDGTVLDKLMDTTFPFEGKKLFEVTISFNKDNFTIQETTCQSVQFKNSLDFPYYDYIWIDGDVAIKGISINSRPTRRC